MIVIEALAKSLESSKASEPTEASSETSTEAASSEGISYLCLIIGTLSSSSSDWSSASKARHHEVILVVKERSKWVSPSEEVIEYVFCMLEREVIEVDTTHSFHSSHSSIASSSVVDIRASSGSCSDLESFFAVFVIYLSFRLVREHLIGFCDLFEYFL